MILQLKEGDRLQIGEAMLVVNETKQSRVKLAVKAKRHVLVRKMP